MTQFRDRNIKQRSHTSGDHEYISNPGHSNNAILIHCLAYGIMVYFQKGRGNDLLPHGTEPLLQAMLTHV